MLWPSPLCFSLPSSYSFWQSVRRNFDSLGQFSNDLCDLKPLWKWEWSTTRSAFEVNLRSILRSLAAATITQLMFSIVFHKMFYSIFGFKGRGTSSSFRRRRKSNCISNSNAASKFFLPFHPQVSISCWEVAHTYAAADIADASRFVSNCWWDGQWHPGNQFRIDYHHGSSWSNSISEFHSIPRKKDQTWKDLIFMPFGHHF